MSYFAWGPHLEVHVEAMNEQHRGIIAAMNHLHALVVRRATRAELTAALDELERITRTHFHDEEEVMAAIEFPLRARHAKLHAKLLDRLADLRQHCAETGQVGEELVHFLRFWLSTHIQGIDGQYGAHVLALRD